jgi:hypothetical protein
VEAGHDVEFLWLAEPQVPETTHADMAQAWGSRLHVVPWVLPPFPFERRPAWLAAANARHAHTPYPLWLKAANTLEGYRQRVVRRWAPDDWKYAYRLPLPALRSAEPLPDVSAYDAIIVNYVFCLGVLLFPPERTVVDTHDVFGHRHRLYRSLGLEPRWFSTTPEAEIRALKPYREVWGISTRDTGYFRQAGLTQARHLGWTLPPVSIPDEPRGLPPEVLVVASGNPLNVSALRWLERAVWPAVVERVEARGGLRPVLRVLGGVGSGTCTDTELTAAYARAAVVLNPTRGGTGLSIKCLEALRHGACLLTSLEHRPEVGFAPQAPDLPWSEAPTTDAPAFADQLVTLLLEPDLRAEYRRRARACYAPYAQANRTALLDAITRIPSPGAA